MKQYISQLTTIFPAAATFHVAMLLFRVAVSMQLMLAHGLKKIGVNGAPAEQVPNPLHLPETLNQGFAIASNLVFPVFIIVGLATRLSALGVLAVTLTGYFVVHWQDSILQKDAPFMYSVAFLLILVLGPGKYAADYQLHYTLTKNKWI